jgi:peptidyl-prolyl cis-trans isomerase SurA
VSLSQGFEIVLRVNERIATSLDYARRRAERIQAIQGSEALSDERKQRALAEVGVATMNELFEELLMLSRADQLRIDVTEAEIEQAMATTRTNYGIESQEQFEQALQASNMTVEGLRSQIRRSLMVQKLMGQEVQPRIRMEEEDLRRYYHSHPEEFQEPERLHLREFVLLESAGLTGDKVNSMAAEIQQQLESGLDLDEIVAPYVEQGVSSRVVDLGWVEIGDLDQNLEEAVWSLGVGEFSQPVEGRGGRHVLLVEERQEARLRTFAEAEQEIRGREGSRLMQAEMQKYMEELEVQAYIVANPPPEAAGFRASLSSSSDVDDLTQALTAPLITEPVEEDQETAGEEDATGIDLNPVDPPRN